jgi:hypothetical protein
MVPVLFAILLPTMIFAQGRQGEESKLLKGFGLNDAQIAQVTQIESSTRETVKADMTHIRIVGAQIQEAYLPASPDLQAIDALIDKRVQFRADIEKSLASARVELTKLMGADNFAKYERFVMPPRWHKGGRFGFGERPGFGARSPSGDAAPMPAQAGASAGQL